jgi:hypothetical protein
MATTSPESIDHAARRAISDVREATESNYALFSRSLQSEHDLRKRERKEDLLREARRDAQTAKTLATILARIDKSESDADARDLATAQVQQRARVAEERARALESETRGALATYSSELEQTRNFRGWIRDTILEHRVAATIALVTVLQVVIGFFRR